VIKPGLGLEINGKDSRMILLLLTIFANSDNISL